MYKYRKIFYENYFNSQAGRRLPVSEVRSNFENEMASFEVEIMEHINHPSSATILDIGCGFGSLVATFHNNGFQNAQGIDISEAMVAEAASLGVKNIKQADLLSFLDNNIASYDIITGMDIIEHFGKDELVEVLFAVKKALKSNGRAIFRTPNADASFYTIYSYGDFTHENYLNVSSATQVILNIGFSKATVLGSYIRTNGLFKEIFRKFSWWMLSSYYRWQLFASGRSSKDVVFSPNLIIIADI